MTDSNRAFLKVLDAGFSAGRKKHVEFSLGFRDALVYFGLARRLDHVYETDERMCAWSVQEVLLSADDVIKKMEEREELIRTHFEKLGYAALYASVLAKAERHGDGRCL